MEMIYPKKLVKADSSSLSFVDKYFQLKTNRPYTPASGVYFAY